MMHRYITGLTLLFMLVLTNVVNAQLPRDQVRFRDLSGVPPISFPSKVNNVAPSPSDAKAIVYDGGNITTSNQLSGTDHWPHPSDRFAFEKDGGKGATPLYMGPHEQVSDPSTFPFCKTAKIQMTFPDGEVFVGTAVFIKPDFLLTAGHCVYSHENGGWATSIDVMPGYDQGYLPYGSHSTSKYFTFQGWTEQAYWEYDIAGITLQAPVGALTGWYGYGWNSDVTLSKYYYWTHGYPAEYPFDVQYQYAQNGTVEEVQPDLLITHNESYGGQSGSGLFNADAMIYGVLSSGTPSYTNFARITSEKFDVIKSQVALSPSLRIQAYDIEFEREQAFIGDKFDGSFRLINNSTVTSASWPRIGLWLDDGDGSYDSSYDVWLEELSPSGELNVYSRVSFNVTPWIPTDAITGYYSVVAAPINEYGEPLEVLFSEPLELLAPGIAEEVVLQTPPDKSFEEYDKGINLSWYPVSFAESYEILVSSDRQFKAFDIYQSNVSYATIELPRSSKDKAFYWKVRAGNQAGWSDFSLTFSFTLVPDRPSETALISPLHNSRVNAAQSILFKWTHVEFADAYELQFSKDETFASIIGSAVTTLTQKKQTIEDLDELWWRVRAKNDGGWGGYSQPSKLRVNRLSVETVPAATEMHLSPNPTPGYVYLTIALSEAQHVNILLQDLLGNAVATLHSNTLPIGTSKLNFEINYPSGVYLVKVETPVGVRYCKLLKI